MTEQEALATQAGRQVNVVNQEHVERARQAREGVAAGSVEGGGAPALDEELPVRAAQPVVFSDNAEERVGARALIDVNGPETVAALTGGAGGVRTVDTRSA
ncbi:MAG: hypothetical protein ACJ8H8_04185, partial [Geminicoccaceae bacterium]